MLHAPPSKPVPVIGLCLGFALLTGCSSRATDEWALRREFSLPITATVIRYAASPSAPAWFGREGLKITMVFQLGPADFDALLRKSVRSGQWRPLPIPETTISHLANIQTVQAAKARSWRAQASPIPKEGSIYNPTDQQMLEQFQQSLPALPRRGWYQIKTAGNDILYGPKITRTQLNVDVDDFILAILDPVNKKVVFRVSSNY
jgi:hypothetical protein